MRVVRGGLIGPSTSLKAGNKDARFALRGSGPYSQPDIRQLQTDRAGAAQFIPQYGNIPTGEVDNIVRTVPTRTQENLWQMSAPSANFPVLVIPRNPERVSLTLCNYFTAGSFAGFDKVYYSYGAPRISPTGAAQGGFPIPPDTTYYINGGSVPVNDIWMWHIDAGAHVLQASEGVEAPEANQ